MKVGDLVRLRELSTNREMVQQWGIGLIEEVYSAEGNVEVIFPDKNWTSRTISFGYIEVVNEGR